MTEIQIPYLPTAQFFKIRCRLGVNEQDIIGDSDSDPQIRTIGGTVSISAMVPRFRYTEADGRNRVVYTKTETYNIQTSTGELFDADGNIGVNLLNTNSPQMDPQGWTYKATVRPNGGEPFDVPIPSDGGGEVFDLGDGLVFTPSTGITDLETRVKALEDAGPSSGGSGSLSWDDITNKPTEFAPSMHDHAVDDISDSTATGRSLVTAADAAAARTAIGAGTSNLAIGTTGTTAAAGNRQASESAIGMVELATTAEATTGTDTQRAVTPAGLKAVADTKAASTHTHDDRYYTETESDARYLQTATAQPINAQTGATYTLVASDAGKLVTLTNAAAITLTIPGNVFNAGQRVDCIVAGAGMVTAVGSSCTVNGTPSLVSRAQYSAFTVLFTSATTAIVIGDLA